MVGGAADINYDTKSKLKTVHDLAGGGLILNYKAEDYNIRSSYYRVSLNTVLINSDLATGAAISNAVGGTSYPTQVPANFGEVEMFSLGFKGDFGNQVLYTEYAHEKSENILIDRSSAYATYGYHFGSWLPHLTYTKVITNHTDYTGLNAYLPASARIFKDNDDRVSSATLGINYSFSAASVWKFDVTRISYAGAGTYTFASYEKDAVPGTSTPGKNGAPDNVWVLATSYCASF